MKLMWYKNKVLAIGPEETWIEFGKALVNSGKLAGFPDTPREKITNEAWQSDEDVYIIENKDK